MESLSRAIERDPFSVNHYRRLMQVYQAKARLTGRADDYNAAVKTGQEALHLYPLDPPGIVSFGNCLLEAGEATQSAERLRSAIEAYERALQLDDTRPDWEKIRRFSPEKRAHIEAKITRARRSLEDVSRSP